VRSRLQVEQDGGDRSTHIFAPDVFVGNLIEVWQSVLLIKGDGHFSRPKDQWKTWSTSDRLAFTRWSREAWGCSDCGRKRSSPPGRPGRFQTGTSTIDHCRFLIPPCLADLTGSEAYSNLAIQFPGYDQWQTIARYRAAQHVRFAEPEYPR
jgi:hypothetical protein